QELEGEPVPEVGYWTFVRSARPYWHRIAFPVTPALLQWTVDRAAHYVRAKRADEVLNKGLEQPQNWSMGGAHKFGASGCRTCQYSPMCDIAQRGDSDDAAA